MKRTATGLSLRLLVASGGCSIAGRLDTANAQLSTATRESAETNQRLGAIQAKLDETNSRVDVIDQAVLKFPGLRPTTEQPIPAAPHSQPAPAAPAR